MIHDVKVVLRLADKIDLKDAQVFCTDKGCDLESLKKQIEYIATKLNFKKNQIFIV